MASAPTGSLNRKSGRRHRTPEPASIITPPLGAPAPRRPRHVTEQFAGLELAHVLRDDGALPKAGAVPVFRTPTSRV
jgi:hypothetical protein